MRPPSPLLPSRGRSADRLPPAAHKPSPAAARWPRLLVLPPDRGSIPRWCSSSQTADGFGRRRSERLEVAPVSNLRHYSFRSRPYHSVEDSVFGEEFLLRIIPVAGNRGDWKQSDVRKLDVRPLRRFQFQRPVA